MIRFGAPLFGWAVMLALLAAGLLAWSGEIEGPWLLLAASSVASAATGFALDNVPWEYKYRWLLERIGMLRERANMADIIHDYPDRNDLIAVIQLERRWSAGLSQTIAALQVEIDNLRKKKHEVGT